MAQCHFQMHFQPPIGHEFYENKKSTNPSGKNAFLIIWPNLYNNFLFEYLTISAKYMYQLKIWQLEECM